MGRYIPPRLRKQQESQSQSAATDSALTESLNTTVQRRLGDLHITADAVSSLDAKEIWDYFQGDDVFVEIKPSTLNATAKEPDRLGYLMLFSGANPRWVRDRIIFAKTKIHLLPGYKEAFPEIAAQSRNTEAVPGPATSVALPSFQKDHQAQSDTPREFEKPMSAEVPADHPIAVFEQMQMPHIRDHKGFYFTGWFTIERVRFLHPQSESLARMLDQKWTRTDTWGRVREIKRDSDAWKKSFSHRWAVVQLKRLQVHKAAPDVKGIQRKHSEWDDDD